MPDQQLPPRMADRTFSPSPGDIASMTHGPEQPNTAKPYLDAATRFSQSGLTGAFPFLRQYMPGWLNTLGDLVQSPAAKDAFSTANIGGFPLVEAFWSPKELDILRRLYGSKDWDPSILPWRTPSQIRQKAFQMGLKRPEIPPYVRQPGTPSIANDPQRVAQVDKLLKKNMTLNQMAMEMGDVSPRTLRRYINENLKTRLLKKSDPSAMKPSMPSFKFQQTDAPSGDPEYENALLLYLQGLGRGK